MKSKLFRMLAVIVSISVIASAVFFAREEANREKAGEAELPTALGKHIEELAKSIPGNGGEPGEGPASAADAEFMARAYPTDTISVANMDAARAAYSNAQGRPFPRGKGRPGTWVSVGPSEALYPFTQFRNSYQLCAEHLCSRRPHNLDCHQSNL